MAFREQVLSSCREPAFVGIWMENSLLLFAPSRFANQLRFAWPCKRAYIASQYSSFWRVKESILRPNIGSFLNREYLD